MSCTYNTISELLCTLTKVGVVSCTVTKVLESCTIFKKKVNEVSCTITKVSVVSNSISTVSAVSCPSYGVTLLAVTRRWGDKTARATGRQGGSQLLEPCPGAARSDEGIKEKFVN